MFAMYAHIWSDFFKEPVDGMPQHEAAVQAIVKRAFLGDDWWAVYDLIGFVLHESYKRENSFPMVCG